ncbi:spermidine/putrescine ABC transporter membrane protein [Adhaeretor mobilis]|uniref:Spermidine/putrescine ABC transporter membrane protein n=1 Tax=Adhaeretor mobilis TaxID=1930276 RepID=A0A517MZJ9_9BACT|nr:spermidine/putrescine ABC transporter membrane protein [Adhaeretor mobilis]
MVLCTALWLTASPRLSLLLTHTAWLTLGTLALSLPLGVPLGVAIGKVEFSGRRLLTCLLISLLFVPLYVHAASCQAAFGYGGWLQQGFGIDPRWFVGLSAAVLVHATAAVPWVALLTAASLASAERPLEEQTLLDAHSKQVLTRVSLPHAGGGIAAAILWIALVCSTEIVVTDLFAVRTFAEEIFTQASLGVLGSDTGESTDLLRGITILLLFTLACFALLAPWAMRVAAVSMNLAPWRWRPKYFRLFAVLTWSLALSIIAFPLVSLAWKAGLVTTGAPPEITQSWSPLATLTLVTASLWDFRREMGWSLTIGCFASLASVVVAALGFWFARRSHWLLVGLAIAAALLLAIPAPMWGVWTVRLLNQPADSLLSPLATLYDHTLVGCVLVQAIRALPIALVVVATQLANIPTEILDAARSDGAGQWRQLMRVALPMRRTAFMTALLVGLAVAIGELSATFLVLPPGVTPLSRRLFGLLHYGADDQVAAVSLALMLLVAVVAGLSLVILGKWNRVEPTIEDSSK